MNFFFVYYLFKNYKYVVKQNKVKHFFKIKNIYTDEETIIIVNSNEILMIIE